jgi:MoxR-like ATPase
VLAHRLLLRPEAALGGVEVEDIVDEVLGSVPVPAGRG